MKPQTMLFRDPLLEVRAPLVGNMPLPTQVFFKPTDTFLQWMKRVVEDRIVVDVGCGHNTFARALARRGIRALGLDLAPPEQPSYEAHHLTADASAFDYPAGCVVTICRPDHSGWARYAADRAYHCGAHAVFYVGKQHNAMNDVDFPDHTLGMIYAGAGKAGEHAFLVFPRDPSIPHPDTDTLWNAIYSPTPLH